MKGKLMDLWKYYHGDKRYSKEYTQYVLKKDFILDGKLICKYEG